MNATIIIVKGNESATITKTIRWSGYVFMDGRKYLVEKGTEKVPSNWGFFQVLKFLQGKYGEKVDKFYWR